MSATAVSPLARAITPTLESQAYAIDRATELLRSRRYGEYQDTDFDRTLSASLGDLRDGESAFFFSNTFDQRNASRNTK